MRKRILMIALLIMLFMPLTVLAEDEYVKCWYDSDNIYYYYNKTSNKFEFSMKNSSGYHEFENGLIKSNFINSDNKLYCPNIWKTITTKSSRQGVTTTYIKNPDLSGALELTPSKTEIYNNENSNTNYEICVYSSKSQKIEFVLDIDSGTILSSQIDTKDVNSNEFSYDDIWQDGKCVDIKDIYASCYDGSRGGAATCNIVKSNPYKGTGSNSSSATIDNEQSTGSENNDNNPKSNENLGDDCDVVPDVVRKWIKIVLNFVKYIALVLVIILGTLDFIKAAGSGETDAMKKAGQSFLKRLVAVILLFLLPMLVDLILHLINLYGSTEDCFKVLE